MATRYGTYVNVGLPTKTPFEDYSFDKRVIFPNSFWVIYWDYWLLLALLWTATVTVFDVFVEDEIGEVMKFHLSVWLLLSVTMDLTFIVDTFIRCFRAFRRKNGTLVSNLSVIRLNYMKSHEFIIDIAASVPFDLLLKTSALVFESSALYHLRFLRLLRLLRLARAYRSLKSSYFYEEIELKFHSAKISLCLVFMGLILMCHWAACVFTWVAREEAYYGVTTTWIDMAH